MTKDVEAMKKVKGRNGDVAVITDHAPALDTIPPQAARLGFAVRIEEAGSSEGRITCQ